LGAVVRAVSNDGAVLRGSRSTFEYQGALCEGHSDDNPAHSSRFGIRGIPTLIVFKSAKEAARQSGAMDLNTLLRWLSGAL
jgi:thioredoxin-like negative regulator of GroEL